MQRLFGIPLILAALFPAAAMAQTPPAGCAMTDLKPIMITHTIPPYPTLSQKLGEHGTTSLAVTVLPDGSASEVSVLKSSGSLRLDDAARDHVQANWRWQSLDKKCTPGVKAQVNLVWDLRNAQQGPLNYILIDLDPADYPADALARGEQGVSLVAVQLSETGAIVNVRIQSSSNFTDLDNKAVEIARSRWQWTPPQMAGKSVPSFVLVAMRWKPQTGTGVSASKP